MSKMIEVLYLCDPCYLSHYVASSVRVAIIPVISVFASECNLAVHSSYDDHAAVCNSMCTVEARGFHVMYR